MMALSLWQPWASLVMAGIKPFEFRTWPAPAAHHDSVIVIHAAARPVRKQEIKELLVDRKKLLRSLGWRNFLDPAPFLDAAHVVLEPLCLSPGRATIGAGLGTVRLGKPVTAMQLMEGTMPADEIDPDMWAWPVDDAQPFKEPIPAKGAQGFWKWEFLQ